MGKTELWNRLEIIACQVQIFQSTTEKVTVLETVDILLLIRVLLFINFFVCTGAFKFDFCFVSFLFFLCVAFFNV